MEECVFAGKPGRGRPHGRGGLRSRTEMVAPVSWERSDGVSNDRGRRQPRARLPPLGAPALTFPVIPRQVNRRRGRWPWLSGWLRGRRHASRARASS